MTGSEKQAKLLDTEEMKDKKEVQQMENKDKQKRRRKRKRKNRFTIRKKISMAWFGPFFCLGFLGFFFVALGLTVLFTFKSPKAELPTTTGIILLACGGALGLLSVLTWCVAPSSSETPSAPQQLATPDQSQTTSVHYTPSAPSGDDICHHVDKNEDHDQLISPYRHAPGNPYQYNSLQPTAPEMPQCETKLPNSSVPILPIITTNTEANIRHADMNSSLLQPNIVLNTYLVLQPTTTNPSADSEAQTSNVNVNVTYTNHL